MDILTHSLSGVAVGTVISSFSKNGTKEKLGIIALSSFGAALPDLDAISLWSGFDNSIGKLFSLSHTGKEIYSSKFWYSHHGFMHSAFAGILFSLFIFIVLHFIKFKKQNSILIVTGFFIGFLFHLFEDMPTPTSAWGGVNLFWPSKSYIGGTGDIWWWNNYDIFLIVLISTVINGLILMFSKYLKSKTRIFTISIFIVALVFCFIQIKTRDCNFNKLEQSSGFKRCEEKSKEIQKQVLGNKLFDLMEKFDKKNRVNF